MLRRQIIEYRKAIYQLLDVRGEKFAYAVLKNKNKIDSLFEDLKKDIQAVEKDEPSKEYLDYLSEREKLVVKHSKKDTDGKPLTKMISRGEGDIEQYVIEDEETLKKEIEEFDKKYEKVIYDREQEQKRITNLENAVLDEEIEVEFHKVKKLPDTINAREMEAASMFMFDNN